MSFIGIVVVPDAPEVAVVREVDLKIRLENEGAVDTRGRRPEVLEREPLRAVAALTMVVDKMCALPPAPSTSMAIASIMGR
jgi:hypothetical protein